MEDREEMKKFKSYPLLMATLPHTLSAYEENIYIYAARYTYSRNTGAAFQVVNSLLNNWNKFSDHFKDKVYKESKKGAVYNKEDWQRVWDKYES